MASAAKKPRKSEKCGDFRIWLVESEFKMNGRFGNDSEIRSGTLRLVNSLMTFVETGNYWAAKGRRERLKTDEGNLWTDYLEREVKDLLNVGFFEFCSSLKKNLACIAKSEKRVEKICRCAEVAVGIVLQVCFVFVI